MTVAEATAALRYSVYAPTSFLFHLAAQSTPHQSIVDETVTVEPYAEYELTTPDPDGNRRLRLLARPGTLSVRYAVTARLSPRLDAPDMLAERPHFELPTAVLPFLTPSRYCESDRLPQLALDEFGTLPPGASRVRAICDWIADRLAYTPGSTNELTTACDVLIQRTGVCRDYAHLAIALCRALCIPARYVSAYAVGLYPPDFHGVFEAFLGNDWYLFDATRKAPTNGLVRIGVGRDAADTSFATIIGAAELEEIAVDARHVDGEPPAVPELLAVCSA